MLRSVLMLLAFCVAAAAVHAAPPTKKASRLAWAELTADQQTILAPLKEDWENLSSERRRKWIGIAKRYPKMQPKEQERVQQRMQRWAALTPEQRAQAREKYRRMARQSAEKRRQMQQRWAEYQPLPPEERRRLAQPPAPGANR